MKVISIVDDLLSLDKATTNLVLRPVMVVVLEEYPRLIESATWKSREQTRYVLPYITTPTESLTGLSGSGDQAEIV